MKHTKAIPVKEAFFMMANGIFSEGYDTNDDGKIDVQTLSSILPQYTDCKDCPIEHVEYPIKYLLDSDYDGWPNYLIADIYGDGDCDGLVTELDTNRPGDAYRMGEFIKKLDSQIPNKIQEES